jgi:hypothetical protein
VQSLFLERNNNQDSTHNLISQHNKRYSAINAFIYFWRYLKNPAIATNNLLNEKNILWIGSFFLLYFGFGYSIVAASGHFIGSLPDNPFISIIPLNRWYLVQTFTTIPLTFIAHAIYSTICYLLCRLMGGQGSFEATFSTQAFTLYMPMVIFMWLPEFIMYSILLLKDYPWPDYLEYVRVFVLPFIWMIVISIIALIKVHKISWWKSAIIVILSLIPSGGISAFFIR